MSKSTTIHRFLVVILTLCLISPGVALAKGRGKKNFSEGKKYEQSQQWDMAAQQFALAVAAEPGNAEYKLHYLQALQRASLMYLKRGDELAEQGDYASAFTAYRTAFNYDQGNEIARLKMDRMLEQQKRLAGGSEPIQANRVGNVMQTSNELPIATRQRSRDVVQAIQFKEAQLKTVVANLGRSLGLNVVFDESVKDQKISIDLIDVTMAKALDIIFKTYKYSFEQVDRRTILVYLDNPTNRPRFESLLVKTFYLGNVSANQARTALTAALPPGRQVTPLDQGAGAGGSGGSVLLVKATATELQLAQDIIDALDKNKNEVVLDVEIYEVSNDSVLEIGNQVVTQAMERKDFLRDGSGALVLDGNKNPISVSGFTGSLSNLGGIGRTNSGTILGSTFSPVLGGVGTLIGLPPSQLKLLQSRGDSKLLYKTQIHVLDGQKNVTKVGKSVPVKIGTSYGTGGLVGGIGGINQGINQPGAVGTGVGNQLAGLLGGFGTPGIDNIQYKDVGLVIDAKPTITNEGYVEIEMKFETSDILASGASSDLTPTFTQRSLNTTARIQDGVTAVVAGINQDVKGNSVAGIPFISMIPILGRFVAAPRQTNTQSDIVITVTPHIVRSQGINQNDHLARLAGQVNAGPTPSVEEVVYRAQQEEDQDRRQIAQQIPQSVPITTPSQVTTTQAASYSQAPSTGSQQTFQPVGNNTNTQRVQKVVNNRSLDPALGPNVSVPTSGPAQNTPVRPEPQTQPQVENQNDQNGGNSTIADPQAKEGEVDPETAVTRPATPFEPTDLIAVRRPENIEKELAKRRAEAARAAKEAGAKEQSTAVDVPKGFVTEGSQQKAPVPAARMVESSRANPLFTFSLSPRPIRQQPGKSFTVAVEVSSQAQMTGADISLTFDPSKLRVKTVKDGGMFGAQPDLNYEVEKGNLVVKIKQTQSSPLSSAVRASGRVILVEFAAVAEGQSEIAFNSNITQVSTAGNTNVRAGGTPTQVIISREAVATATNEK
ncbi:MAG: cohesin domain-containing protein [Acidobacteria bacterium]|nr:cohesin domain-containing protein [Acidobacteriota bacterium]